MGNKQAARLLNGRLRDTAREIRRQAERARKSGDSAQAEHLDKLALVAQMIAETTDECPDPDSEGCPDCEGRGCSECTGVEAE